MTHFVSITFLMASRMCQTDADSSIHSKPRRNTMTSTRRMKPGWSAALALALMAMAAGGGPCAGRRGRHQHRGVGRRGGGQSGQGREVRHRPGLDHCSRLLVFWMQAGFALVETGLTRAKNACNIIMKNLLDFAMASVAFFVLGSPMFGNSNGFCGSTLLLPERRRGMTGASPSTSSSSCSPAPPRPSSRAPWRNAPSSPPIWSTAAS
ncbi:MAG: hypothetical protein U1G05_19920 [Kiritimatiellia bacterium]